MIRRFDQALRKNDLSECPWVSLSTRNMSTSSSRNAINKKRSRDPTEFERKVYDVVKRIPPGYVASYQTVAQEVGTCPRAIGGAMRGNPFAPVVP